jgi:hypothetical protein
VKKLDIHRKRGVAALAAMYLQRKEAMCFRSQAFALALAPG